MRQVLRKLTRNSEAQASIESGQYTLQYVSLPLSSATTRGQAPKAQDRCGPD